MELKLDLHIHSNYSPDSYNTIDVIHSRLVETRFDGYALTDHDTVSGHKEAFEKAGDLVFVPALEVSAKGGHVVVLDPSDVIPVGLSLSETVDHAHDQEAFALMAHPYGLPRSWPNVREVTDAGFDAIEVANSAQVPYQVICELNRRLAERLQLPITGGSDSHLPATIGRSYTVVDSESRDYRDVIKAVKLGRTRVGGSFTTFGDWFEKIFHRRLGLV